MAHAVAALENGKAPYLAVSKLGFSLDKSKFKSAFRKPQPPPRPHGRAGYHSPYSNATNASRFSPYESARMARKSKLSTIQENNVETDERSDNETEFMNIERSFLQETVEEDEGGEEGNSESEVGSEFEGWDDETTLVAKLQDNVPGSTERERLADLADQLEGPMQARGATLKQYLAHTIAPAGKKVKEVHNALEQKFDLGFGIGILKFDDACKKMEQLVLRDEDELKHVYVETQRNIKELFRQLKAAYDKKEQLWQDLRETIEKSSEKAIAVLNSVQPDLDVTIASIEKKSREVMKSGGVDGKARQKLLRELLAEM